ncbi:hypothetical protein JMJ35_008004 [Cladonia borealis]|uniref:Uncharacterized protein n=1 Tax=Cladonia borealis TaxID=184061 RepID=A0AA39V770_9LECA|nr:hypothetical protein JMJ35_008004 [Cladonia borealis]
MPRRYNTRDAKDAVPGDIFWLSPRPTGPGGPQTNSGIRDIFDHPVLVLSIHTAEHIACVLILSSLNGKSINEYSRVASIRASHLPIYPAPAHPDSGKVLFLDNGLRLDRDTNVKLKTRYLLPLSLINFRYCDHRTQQKYTLQSVSLNIVLDAVDSGQPAKYLAGIGDSLKKSMPLPSKSIPSPPDSMRPAKYPAGIGDSLEKSMPLPSKSIPSPPDSMRPTYTTLVFLSFFIVMAYWIAHAKA